MEQNKNPGRLLNAPNFLATNTGNTLDGVTIGEKIASAIQTKLDNKSTAAEHHHALKLSYVIESDYFSKELDSILKRFSLDYGSVVDKSMNMIFHKEMEAMKSEGIGRNIYGSRIAPEFLSSATFNFLIVHEWKRLCMYMRRLKVGAMRNRPVTNETPPYTEVQIQYAVIEQEEYIKKNLTYLALAWHLSQLKKNAFECKYSDEADNDDFPFFSMYLQNECPLYSGFSVSWDYALCFFIASCYNRIKIWHNLLSMEIRPVQNIVPPQALSEKEIMNQTLNILMGEPIKTVPRECRGMIDSVVEVLIEISDNPKSPASSRKLTEVFTKLKEEAEQEWLRMEKKFRAHRALHAKEFIFNRLAGHCKDTIKYLEDNKIQVPVAMEREINETLKPSRFSESNHNKPNQSSNQSSLLDSKTVVFEQWKTSHGTSFLLKNDTYYWLENICSAFYNPHLNSYYKHYHSDMDLGSDTEDGNGNPSNHNNNNNDNNNDTNETSQHNRKQARHSESDDSPELMINSSKQNSDDQKAPIISPLERVLHQNRYLNVHVGNPVAETNISDLIEALSEKKSDDLIKRMNCAIYEFFFDLYVQVDMSNNVTTNRAKYRMSMNRLKVLAEQHIKLWTDKQTQKQEQVDKLNTELGAITSLCNLVGEVNGETALHCMSIATITFANRRPLGVSKKLKYKFLPLTPDLFPLDKQLIQMYPEFCAQFKQENPLLNEMTDTMILMKLNAGILYTRFYDPMSPNPEKPDILTKEQPSSTTFIVLFWISQLYHLLSTPLI